jgi:hypothetical protein
MQKDGGWLRGVGEEGGMHGGGRHGRAWHRRSRSKGHVGEEGEHGSPLGRLSGLLIDLIDAFCLFTFFFSVVPRVSFLSYLFSCGC